MQNKIALNALASLKKKLTQEQALSPQQPPPSSFQTTLIAQEQNLKAHEDIKDPIFRNVLSKLRK